MSTEPNEPTSEAAFFTTIRSWGMVRGDDRVFGGVLSGVGARLGMAPAATRLLFALLALFTGGIALLAYAAAWALLPDSQGRIVIQDFGRGTPNVGVLVAIGVLAFFGFVGLNWGIGRWGGWWNIDVPGGNDFGSVTPRLQHLLLLLIPLAVIGGVIWLIVWAVRQGKQPSANPAQGFARLPDGTVPQAPVTPGAFASEATPAGGPDPSAEQPDAHATSPVPVFAAAVPIGAAVPATGVAQAYAAPPAPPVYTGPKYDYKSKPRVPGPGKFGYLAALAMIPLSVAITLYIDSQDMLAVFPGLAMAVIWTAGLGLILVINALRGRKAGFLGFVSFVALIPMGLSIAYADEVRENFQSSWGGWGDWSWDGNTYQDPETSYSAEPIYTAEPFDVSGSFLDYESVAINGSCYEQTDPDTPGVTGTVRLSDVAANQSITVTSTDTRLSIPRGTSLNIVNTGGGDGAAYAMVSWEDRDLSCELATVGSPAVQLSNAGAPVLTVELDDTMTDGFMTLWIEEN